MNVTLGIDVDSKQLVTCLVVDKERANSREKIFKNTKSGIHEIYKYIKKNKISRVVMEATGGYEREAAKYFSLKGILTHVIRPVQGRKFAQGLGIFAKNDSIDAFVLGYLGQVANLPVLPPPRESQVQLKPLAMRRSQLIEMITQEKNRLRTADVATKGYIKEHIEYLKERTDELEEKMTEIINGDEVLMGMNKALTKVVGYGPVTAAAILGLLPEIGRVSNKAVGALAGLAPMADDSGKRKGKRCIKGGRWHLRKALYMPIFSSIKFDPVINAFYNRLLGKGKQKKVAIVAAMRKVLVRANAIVRNHLQKQNLEYEKKTIQN